MGAEGHAECAVREDGERLGDAAFFVEETERSKT